MTSQGHPHTIFRRAIDNGNIVAAELAARELRGLRLADAHDLTALVALRDRQRGERMAVRWLQRWLDETSTVTLADTGLVVAALAALGGVLHAEAVVFLRSVT